MGNSLALRIPSEIAVGEGHSVDLQVSRGRLIFAPVAKNSCQLSDLVSGINVRNRHSEIRVGKPRSQEVW